MKVEGSGWSWGVWTGRVIPDNSRMATLGFLRRVVLKNYKSIAACDVRLSALSYLVGPNGSGKSNFLDALRFVSDSLRNSLDQALRDRGSINEVRRRSSGHPNHFGVRLEFQLSEFVNGHYAFEIAARSGGAFSVKSEECVVNYLSRTQPETHAYRIEDGIVDKHTTTLATPPAGVNDRLYLVNVSGLPDFRPVYEALSRMGFYSLNPEAIRDLQTPDAGELLRRDGSNLASVLAVLQSAAPEVKGRVEEYLARIVPGITSVSHKPIGPKETLEFRQQVVGAKEPWRFLAVNMSDGTLRALGILVAVLQTGPGGKEIPLVGIEEPEVALHPAAMSVLLDSLTEASRRRQVLVTSHSPDLLDEESIPDDSLLAVVSDQGVSRIDRIDSVGRSALQDHLYTAGELLRMNELRPNPDVFKLQPDQLELFGPVEMVV